MKQVLVIAGPTASGKTGLAISLAKHYGGEVVSADSMQIYQHMDIASAKPTPEEMGTVKHHMLDFVSPFTSFSVADYVKLAHRVIRDIISRGKLPIICGGTGLYISSLIDNLSFVEEDFDPALRERLTKQAETEGIMPLYEKLQKIDPEACEKIHPHNTKRVIRALEIYETTGITLTEQNKRSKAVPSPYDPFMIALCPPRELLYQRIDRRVEDMVEKGLFEETKKLSDMGLTRDMQSMQGIGYKEAFMYLEGILTKEECIQAIQTGSRRYAKRQLTWFRRDERYRFIDPTQEGALATALEEFTWKNP